MHGRPSGPAGDGLIVLGRVQGEVAEQFAILTQDPDIEVAHLRTMILRPVWARPTPVVELGPVKQGDDRRSNRHPGRGNPGAPDPDPAGLLVTE